MNWMGGARNRLRFNGDRNVQKEFFDRKRLGPKLSVDRNLLKKERQVSQDLLALQTVNRTHSKSNNGPTDNRPFKSVDLDKFHSCTRQINEIDMGPCSPGKISSSLLLADGKTDNRLSNQTSVKFHESQSTHISKRHQDLSRDWMKNKSKLAVDRDSGYSFSDQSLNKEGALPQKKPEHFEEKYISSSNHESNFDMKMDESSEEKINNLSLGHKQKNQRYDSPFKMVYNPFVSEDFQVTPVTKYDLHKKDHKHRHRHHHKSKASKNYCETESLNETKRYSRNVPFQFSSTPMKRNLDQNKDIVHQNSGIQLSPIKKLSSNYKDDFQYKPRLMTTPKHSQAHLSNKPHALDVSHTESVMELYARNNSQSDSNFHYNAESQRNETPLQKPVNLEMTTPVMHHGPSDFYKNQHASGNKDNLSNSFCDKDSDTGKLFKSNQTPCSALSMYKNALSENEDISPEDLPREKKPKFIDIEDDFVYKPNLSFGKLRTTTDRIQFSGPDTAGVESHSERPHDQYIIKDTNGLRSKSTPCSNLGGNLDHLQSSFIQENEQLMNKREKEIMLKNKFIYPGSDGSLILTGGRENIPSPLQYVPIKDQMEDVLKEMSDLEKQDKQESQTSLDVALNAMESHNEIPNSAGDEADKFLESENLDLDLMNHDLDKVKAKLEAWSSKKTTETSPSITSLENYAFSQDNMPTEEADSEIENTSEQIKHFVDHSERTEVEKNRSGSNNCIELPKHKKVDKYISESNNVLELPEETEGDKCRLDSNSDGVDHDRDRDVQLDISEELLNISGNTLKGCECDIVVQVADVSSGKNQATQTVSQGDIHTVETQTYEPLVEHKKILSAYEFHRHLESSSTQPFSQHVFTQTRIQTENIQTNTQFITKIDMSTAETQTEIQQSPCIENTSQRLNSCTQTDVNQQSDLQSSCTQTRETDLQSSYTQTVVPVLQTSHTQTRHIELQSSHIQTKPLDTQASQTQTRQIELQSSHAQTSLLDIQSSYAQTEAERHLETHTSHTQTDTEDVFALKMTSLEKQSQTTDVQIMNTHTNDTSSQPVPTSSSYVPNLIQLACGKISKLTKRSMF